MSMELLGGGAYMAGKPLLEDSLANINQDFTYNVPAAQFGQHDSMSANMLGLQSFAGQMGGRGNEMFGMAQGLFSGDSPYLQAERERLLQGVDDTTRMQMRNIGTALSSRGMGQGGLSQILGEATGNRANEQVRQGNMDILGKGFQAGTQMMGMANQAYGTQGQALGQAGSLSLGLTDQMNQMSMQSERLGHQQRQYELTSAYNQQLANRENKAGFLSNIIGSGASIASAKIMFGCIPEGTSIDTPDGDGFNTIENIKVGDKVIGYNGKPVKVLQKHSYLENKEELRFYSIKFKDSDGKESEVNVSDSHRVRGVCAKNITHADITSKEVYKGVERSYDLLTEDKGYQIDGIPVNSMIEEMAHSVQNPSLLKDWDLNWTTRETKITYID